MHWASLLLLTAAGVSAHPSGHSHAHAHRSFHAKNIEKRKTISAVIDGKTVSWDDGSSPFVQAVHPSSAPASTPSTYTPAAATPASAPSTGSSLGVTDAVSYASGGSGQGLSTYQPFDTSCGSTSKRATEADIMYKGNTGCPNYGDNFKLVQSGIASQYNYNIKIISGACKTNCVVWNKVGADNKLDGFFSGHEALNFFLDPNTSQYLAIAPNSQGALSCFCNQVPTTTWGEFQGAWTEFDMGSAKNSGWSGADASVLVAGNSGPTVSALKVSLADGSQASSVDGNGGGVNAYLTGDAAKDGIGANIPPGPVSIVADYSYQA